MEATAVRPAPKKVNKTLNYYKRYWTLYLLLALPVAFFIIFRYFPMAYVMIAFKKYNITQSIWVMPWAKNFGFEYFIKAFANRDFIYAIRNTLLLNGLDLIIGFPAPIILAILLNELVFQKFKRFTQTVAYMPHFLSWVIINGLVLQLLGPTNGLVNILINKMGFETVPFINNPTNWVFTYIFVGIWQSIGWNTIIYMASIAGINTELYEAASVDGAGRLRKIWNITLPGLRSTIVVLLLLNVGNILGGGFERPYALMNNLVASVANVIPIFVYNNGIRSMQFSLTTAVGLFQSVVCVIFLVASNALAEKFGERGVL